MWIGCYLSTVLLKSIHLHVYLAFGFITAAMTLLSSQLAINEELDARNTYTISFKCKLESLISRRFKPHRASTCTVTCERLVLQSPGGEGKLHTRSSMERLARHF